MHVCVVRIVVLKQKTAYEMRISDWSSDVCSSDLSPWARSGCRCASPCRTPTARRSARRRGGCGSFDLGLIFAAISARGVATFYAAQGPTPAANRRNSMYQQELARSGKRLFFIRGTYIYITIAISRSEEHTSELQSLMRISYAVFCLK